MRCMGMGLWVLLIIFFLGSWLYNQKLEKERKKDLETDYSKEDLGGIFYEMPNGETWLKFKYDKNTQQNKKQYILETVLQNREMEDEYGYVYYVSKLINYEHYENDYGSNNILKSKNGPYVAYKMVPKPEMKQSNISIDRTSGPVQVSTGNSTAYQYTENSAFSSKVYEYKDVMISNGILKEDIEVVMNHPDDSDLKQSFLSKYGLELAKITVNIAGTVVSLLSLLKS
ncbi:hypothetical protein HB849_10010 [Listeria fleischmannii]|nr:hypothetical protein [Listeria fleischmannii]